MPGDPSVAAGPKPPWLRIRLQTGPNYQAVRGLMLGGDVAWPLTQSLLWSGGLLVVFFPLALRAYRRRT